MSQVIIINLTMAHMKIDQKLQYLKLEFKFAMKLPLLESHLVQNVISLDLISTIHIKLEQNNIAGIHNYKLSYLFGIFGLIF